MKFEIKMREVGRQLQKHLPEILTGIAVGGTVVSDVLYIYNGVKISKETKDGKNPNYIKAYWLPTTISAGSIAAIIFSNRLSSKEKTLLLGMAVANGAQLRAYQDIVEKNIPIEESAEILDQYEDLDIEKLMIDADAADETESYEEDSRLFYFPQIHKVVKCSTDQFNTAVLNINELYSSEWEVTINNFFDFIDKDIVKNDPELKECGDDFGWEIDPDDPESGITRILISQYTKKLKSGIDLTYVYFVDPPLHRSEWENYYSYEKQYWNNKHEVEQDIDVGIEDDLVTVDAKENKKEDHQ